MKIGYRAGYREGFEDGYREALNDSKPVIERQIEAGARLATRNILDRLMARPKDVPLAQWFLKVMQECEEALELS